MLAEARSSGATVVDLESTPVNVVTRQMPLTLILNPSKELAISKEEIFGPILPVFGYDTVEEVVAEVNRGERPLGLCAFRFIYSFSILSFPSFVRAVFDDRHRLCNRRLWNG
jgi:coniferyl-aldehyde dehydrogenase